MTSPILWAGGEDLNFTPVNNTFVNTIPTVFGNCGPDTTTNACRSGYARQGFSIVSSFGNGGTTTDTVHYMRTAPGFTATSFWVSFRVNVIINGANGSSVIAAEPIRFVDSNGIVRLKIVYSNVNGSPGDTFVVKTGNTAGTFAQIGSTSTGRYMSIVAVSSAYAAVPDKIDIFVNYAVAGQFTVYLNGVQTFTFSGDITTNSVTSLAYIDFGQTMFNNTNGITCRTAYSEMIVSTRDTRNMSLVTQSAIVGGNTTAWNNSGVTTPVVTTIGSATSTSSRGANIIAYVKFFTGSQNASVTTLQFWLSSAVTGTTQMAVYTDNGGLPSSLLASTGTVVNPSSGFTTYTLSSTVLLTGTTTYWLAFRSTGAWTAGFTGSGSNSWYEASGTSFPSTASGLGSQINSGLLCTYASIFATNTNLYGISYSAPDYSTTANQIQEYQISPSIPSGSFSVVSVVHCATATVGNSGPTKFDFVVRTGGADFLSTDQVPTIAWAAYNYMWDSNPNTATAWQTSDLASGSTSFNIGFKSIT